MASPEMLDLYIAADAGPDQLRTVHVGAGGGATLCARLTSNFVCFDPDREVADEEICEKCLVWVKDLSLRG
jgi:hypothetical protein